MLTKTTHSFMTPKSMSSEVENIELKGKEKKHKKKKKNQTMRPTAHKSRFFNHLQAPYS